MPENEKTLTPQEIAEQRKVAEQKKISSVTAPITPGAAVQGPSASEQAITNAYDDAIGQTSLLIKGLEGRRANALQQDETAQRKSRNMQMIAGISDGLASLANLIGVGDRGTNIDMGTGALTPLQQKFENARLERKADIKSIDDRLDQYRRQLDQMRMQKGLAVAQQKEREESRRHQTAERLATQAHSDAQLDKKLSAELVKTNANLSSTAYQKALDRANAKEVAAIRSGNKNTGRKGATSGFILTGEDGAQQYYEMSKTKADAIKSKMAEAMSSDLAADTSTDDAPSELRKAWNDYQALLVQERVGVGADEELQDARNKVINLSPYMRSLIENANAGAGADDDDDDEFASNRV